MKPLMDHWCGVLYLAKWGILDSGGGCEMKFTIGATTYINSLHEILKTF